LVETADGPVNVIVDAVPETLFADWFKLQLDAFRQTSINNIALHKCRFALSG
jgi:hypothetical protein